jgi:Fe-S cluster biosynthesis and repair protein YggX
MSATVMCARLRKELPAIDVSTPAGNQAARVCKLIGGAALQQRVLASVSMQAWQEWTDYMRMILNEYRLDPTSDETNEVLKPYMEDFFFGEAKAIDNWTPPAEGDAAK